MGVDWEDAIPLDISRARQLLAYRMTTTAMHSVSQGWLPALKLDFEHRPLGNPDGEVEETEVMCSISDLRAMGEALIAAADRAEEDFATGKIEVPNE